MHVHKSLSLGLFVTLSLSLSLAPSATPMLALVFSRLLIAAVFALPLDH